MRGTRCISLRQVRGPVRQWAATGAVGLALLCTGGYGAQKEVVSIPSVRMHTTYKATVIVPQDYTHSTERYCVLYLLHGYNQHHDFWSRLVDLTAYADAMGCIFVCPEGKNGWYADSPVESDVRFASYVTEEVVAWIDSAYRTRARPACRGVIGSSMGGYGALSLCIRNQDVFGAAGGISAILNPAAHHDKWGLQRLFGPYKENTARWDGLRIDTLLARHGIAGNTLLVLTCGSEDPYVHATHRALHRFLLQADITHFYSEHTGKHTHAFVRRVCGYQFALLMAHMQGT